jgi:GT2 family glycosyltransferase
MDACANPWLPWVDTIQPVEESPGRGVISVVIPTAALDIARLQGCLESLTAAAEEGEVRVTVVLCPTTPEKECSLRDRIGTCADIRGLAGPFNYCRSINYGLSTCGRSDRYALFLNDDVTFTEPEGITCLADTLRRERWACVGPYILHNPSVHDDTWPAAKSSVGIVRQLGAVRTNAPVSGSCALWDLQWLNRIGPLDEEFGVGWGMDEADMCIRTLRLGGRYGRQDAVAIRHLMHATFGAGYTKYAGEPHMHSLRHFQRKYGEAVEEWGRSHHWWPLPGVHVVVIARNSVQKMLECLKSVEVALTGYRWILSLGISPNLGDVLGQPDRSLECTADHVARVVLSRPTRAGSGVGQYVRETANASAHLHAQYPATYLLAGDSTISPFAVSNLLWRARDNGHLCLARTDGEIRAVPVPTAETIISAMMGKCDMVFHASLLPHVCRSLNGADLRLEGRE